MPDQKKKLQKMQGSDACMLMHTALRKHCDSPITTAAYNLIHLLSALPAEEVPVRFSPWLVFGALVVKQLPRGRAAFAVTEAISKFDEHYSDLCDRARAEGIDVTEVSPHAWTAHRALDSVLGCFDAEDVEGMASFLVDH